MKLDTLQVKRETKFARLENTKNFFPIPELTSCPGIKRKMIVLTKCLLTEWQGTSLIAFNNRQQVPANRICRPDGTGPPTNRNKRHPCVICSKDSPIETNDGARPTRLSWMQCRRFVAKSDSTTKFSQIMRFTIKLTAVISIYRYRRRKKVFSIGPGGG